MRVGGVATLNLSFLLRETIAGTQRKLLAAQVEVATGRHADVGLALGAAASRALDWRSELAGLEGLADRDGVTAVRTDVYQQTLKAVGDLASSFMSTLAGSRNARGGQALAKSAAAAAQQQLTALINTSHDSQLLFAGHNSAAPPLADYPASPAKAAVDAAFLQRFGVSQDDSAVANISSAAMAEFLDGDFAAQFSPDGWATNWSSATDSTPLARIAPDIQVRASVSANIAPLRQLMQAFTMVAELGTPGLNQSAFEAIVDGSMELVGTALSGLGEEQARLGLAEGQIETARQRIDIRIDTLKKLISGAESVNEYEAATRVNMLMTQMETSYTLTGRISRLSLLNYL